jgi:hypothetical protein
VIPQVLLGNCYTGGDKKWDILFAAGSRIRRYLWLFHAVAHEDIVTYIRTLHL